MAANKARGRGKSLILAERRKRIAELRLKGWTQVRIAVEVGVSQRVVCRDLQVIEQDWKELAARDIGTIKALANARYEMLLEENLAAYERSVGDRDTKTMKDDGESQEKVLRTESSPGDPRFLHNAERVVDRIVDLHQAGGPKQLNINDISKRPTDQLLDRLVTLVPGAAELLASSGGGSDPGRAGSPEDRSDSGSGESDEEADGE